MKRAKQALVRREVGDVEKKKMPGQTDNYISEAKIRGLGDAKRRALKV